MQLVGTLVGVLCNKTWPDWLITICLVCFLSWLTRVTAKKGLTIHNAESQATEALETSSLLTGPASNPGKFSQNRHYSTIPNAPEESVGAAGASLPANNPDDVASSRKAHIAAVGGEELQDIYRTDALPPFKKLALMALLWVTIVMISLIKGGEGASIAGVKCNSGVYWFFFMLPFPVFITVVLYLAAEQRSVHARKEALGYDFKQGDVMWNPTNSIFYPLLNLVVGFGSGSLGIGGGAMTGPLMLHLGMHPQVVSATAAFMIVRSP